MRDDGKINILLVDDKPDKLLALEAVLEDLHQNVVRAYSGREALRRLMTQEFAVILLDVNMPGMDGFETASLIRQRKSTEHVPIIFVTAFGDDDHRTRGYSLGAVDYIQTPIMPEVLKTKVTVFVDLFRKNEQVRQQAQWLGHRAAQLHTLTEAYLAINSARSMERILQVATDTARDILYARCATTMFLRDGKWAHAQVMQSRPKGDAPLAPPRRAREDGIRGLVCSTNKPMRLLPGELEARGAVLNLDGSNPPRMINGWLAAPLVGRDGHNMGMIEVFDKNEGEFTGDDEAVLVQLTQMASVAIVNTIFAEERETNHIKDEFLSTLSHELRTPLNAILGWTQLLRMQGLDPKANHGLEVIERNAQAQAKLVEDLLDVSRVTTGKLRINLRLVQLGSIVESSVEAIRPNAQAKDLKLSYKCDAETTAMMGDADRLPQVVWNLLSNAVKFTPANGNIDVRLHRQDEQLQLEVRDSGKGIGAAFLPYVFDRFRQADSSSTRSHGGLGIGLTIVRRIVELHGGSVKAHSAGEDRGATFTVIFPVGEPVSPEAPVGGGSPRAEESAQLHGVSVLVVDDEADARDVVARILGTAGAVTHQAAGVAEAMQRLGAERPDIVISDIAMPEEDGYDLIRRVRGMSGAMASLPVIALTAYASDEDRARAFSAGFDSHVAKPISPEELLSAVRRLTIRHGEGNGQDRHSSNGEAKGHSDSRAFHETQRDHKAHDQHA